MTARRRLLRTLAVAVAVVLAALGFLLGRGIAPPSEATVAERLRPPPGFRVQVYSSEVPLARVMVFTPGGDLIVSRTRGNLVSLLERDRDGDGQADGHRVLFDDLKHTTPQ